MTLLLCLVLSAGACLGWSQEPSKGQAQRRTPQMKLKMTRIRSLPVEAGKEMYNSYCAACHGENGKGYGPAWPVLSKGAPDLTVLTLQNQGRFPKYKVTTALSQFGESHQLGTRAEMPDWYKAFVSLDRTCPFRAGVRARSISNYVETLQVR